MRLVNYRERSSGELAQKLLGDGYEPAVAARAVARMQELGLQDNERFAIMFARGRWRSNSMAPAQITHRLRLHGVGEPAIKAALEEVFGPGGRVAPGGYDGDEEDDDEERGGGGRGGVRREMSAWEQLVEQARRTVERTEGEDSHKRRAKLARWLQYRGHGWDTVKKVMKEVGL
ncbi:MAG: regulatory protein RecX [Monoraphidium minutum]|nr:MAG: regulatory protein RecX [Monoraphidium minutum]